MNRVKFLLIVFMALLILPVLLFAKQHVHIMATGGAIAGITESKLDNSLQASNITAHGLIQLVPEIEIIAEISATHIFNKSSQNFVPDDWVYIAKQIKEKVSDKSIDAIVVTHGTDTMEETAYFVNLTVKTKKPIIFVGASRPYNHIGTDMKINLLDAVSVAINKKSIEKGVVIVMNGNIFSARDAIKQKTTGTDIFQGYNKGVLGHVYSIDEVEYNYLPAKKHTYTSHFNIDKIKALPQVDILYYFLGNNLTMLPSLIKNGAEGFVLVGVGNGNFSDSSLSEIKRVTSKGIPVVRSSRAIGGLITRDAEVDDQELNTIRSNNLSIEKSRILLMLSMLKTKDRKKIQENFNTY